MRVADCLVDTLSSYGVDRVFGIPGDAINHITEAIRRAGIRFILASHEGAASFMASAYSRVSNRLGCCLTTCGAGAVNSLSGLYDAKFSRAPVVVVTGQVPTYRRGTRFMQEVDTISVLSDVAGYSVELVSVRNAQQVFKKACLVALNEKTVAHISIPSDIAGQDTHVEELRRGNEYEGDGGEYPDQLLEKASRIIASSDNLVIAVSEEGFGLSDTILELSEKLGAPVVCTYAGKGVVDERHKNYAGITGYGVDYIREGLEEADTLLLIGSEFPYSEMIEKIPERIVVSGKLARPDDYLPSPTLLVNGDIGVVLRNLLERLGGRRDGGRLLERMTSGRKEMEKRLEKMVNAESGKGVVNPYKLVNLVGRYVNEDGGGFSLSVDTGLVTDIFLSSCRLNGRSRVLLSYYMWSMGCSVPYAIGSYNAQPTLSPVAFVGDGGLLMSLGELATLKRLNIPAKVIVFNNEELALIKYEQRNLDYEAFGVELGSCDFSKVAQALGLDGIRVEDEKELVKKLDGIMKLNRPVLVDVKVDKEAPPLVW